MCNVRSIGAAAAAVFFIATTGATAGGPPWLKIVNNGQTMPNSTKKFNSYNQPSVNERGLVVFRARSKGPQQPTRGIYAVDAFLPPLAIALVADVDSQVPAPNNIQYPPGSGAFATFQEFPSFPRIDAASDMLATRGQSQPVWNYLLPDGTETSVGTAGIYATVDGALVTGVNLLGAVADPKSGELVFPWWQVPGAAPGTRFDQFPGAGSPCDGEFIAFKGNWTDAIALAGRTGVYFRSLTDDDGEAPVVRIVDSQMAIPGQDAKVPVLFGSTAPPSASGGKLVFVGLDNEEVPTMGGIYLAALAPDPELTPLVEIGDEVPGVSDDLDGDGRKDDSRFTRIGEALSFDGRWVAFWGAWGTETREILLTCPTDGNADVLAYCNEQYPNGYVARVPVRQGIFIADTRSGRVVPVAIAGEGFDDFVYWNFSGSPGTGGDEGGDQEPPRWRSTSFVAVDSTGPAAYRVAFKAKMGTDDAIAARTSAPGQPASIVVSTQTAGVALDAQAPAGSLVSAIGIERDGLRNGRLALTASMLNQVTGEAWAGIYLTTLPPVNTCTADLDGDGEVDAQDLGELLACWGPCEDCPADLNADGEVDATDLAILLSAWGECP